MNAKTEVQLNPVEILATYERADDTCPALMAKRIPAATDETIQALRSTLALARDSRDWNYAVRLATTLGLLNVGRMNLHDARLNVHEVVSILRTLDVKLDLAQALGNLATIEYCLGNSEDAIVYAREAIELASDLQLLIPKGYLLTLAGAILAYRGQYADSEAAFTEAQQALSHNGDNLGLAWWQFTYARELARDRSHYEDAIKLLEQALPVLRQHTTPSVVIEVLLTLADCYLTTKNLIRADNLIKEAEGLINQGKRYWSRPELYLLKARLAVAEENDAQAIKHAYTGLGAVGDQGDLRLLAPLYRTVAALLEHDRTRGEDIQDALDRAIAIGRKRSRRIELARALQQAGLHLRLGNRPTIRARSSGFLYEADRMMTEMGMITPQLAIPSTSTSADV